MNIYDWDETAREFARHVCQFRGTASRGALALKFIDESVRPPRFVEDAPLVVGVFGIDRFVADPLARFQVDLVRQRLHEFDAAELGFGVSADGSVWVLLVGTAPDRYRTAAGKAMQKELLKLSLEQKVWDAWRKVSGFASAAAAEICL
jgi:hypothetical protein